MLSPQRKDRLSVSLILPEVIQAGAKFLVVVQFAVERHHSTCFVVRHRLMTSRGDVNDRESAVAESDTSVQLVCPDALVIGSAMGERVGHPSNFECGCVRIGECFVVNCRDPADVSPPLFLRQCTIRTRIVCKSDETVGDDKDIVLLWYSAFPLVLPNERFYGVFPF